MASRARKIDFCSYKIIFSARSSRLYFSDDNLVFLYYVYVMWSLCRKKQNTKIFPVAHDYCIFMGAALWSSNVFGAFLILKKFGFVEFTVLHSLLPPRLFVSSPLLYL